MNQNIGRFSEESIRNLNKRNGVYVMQYLKHHKKLSPSDLTRRIMRREPYLNEQQLVSQVEEILQTGFNTGVLQRFGDKYMVSVPTQPIEPPPVPMVDLEDRQINSPTYIPALERKRNLYLRQQRQLKEQLEQQSEQEQPKQHQQKQKQEQQALSDEDSESEHSQDSSPTDFSANMDKKQKLENKATQDDTYVPESETRDRKSKIRRNSATYIPELERKQQARSNDNRNKHTVKKNKKTKSLKSEENSKSTPDSNEDSVGSSKNQRNRKSVSKSSQTTYNTSGSGGSEGSPVVSKRKQFSSKGKKGYRRSNSSDSISDEDYEDYD